MGINEIGEDDAVTRVKEIRQRMGLSRREFAGRMGVKGNTWGNLEQRVNPLSDRYINLVCLTYRIRKDWLLNGTGDRFEPDEPKDAGAVSSDAMEFAKEFDELVGNNRKAVVDYMRTVLAAQRNTMAALEAAKNPSARG